MLSSNIFIENVFEFTSQWCASNRNYKFPFITVKSKNPGEECDYLPTYANRRNKFQIHEATMGKVIYEVYFKY